MPQRAAGYIRVSTVEQTEGLSLSAQHREIKRYAEQHGHALVDVYADEGVSAHLDDITKRPAPARLLADAEARKFDTIIVHTIDRWARNSLVQRLALQQLGEAGVGFVSITERHDFSSPQGKLLLTMLGGVSEFFSDALSVHVQKGVRERAEQGLHVGPVPFGFETKEPRQRQLSAKPRPAETPSHGGRQEPRTARSRRSSTTRDL